MKLPRKGILIRLAIYLPIIGYLAWQALSSNAEPEPAPQTKTPGRVRTLQGPDGEEMKIIEITSEEARAMGVEIPEKPEKAPADNAPAEQPAAAQ